MHRSIATPLDAIALLTGLTPEARAEVVARCRFRRFRPGELLLARDSPSRDVLFILEGRVEILDRTPAGREISLAVVAAGGHVGELAALDRGFRAADVRALEPGRVAILDAENFRRLLVRHGEMALRLLCDLVRILRCCNLRLAEIAGLSVRARLARELLRRARPEGAELWLRPAPTQEVLATRLATTRESVARALSELARDGLLQRRGRALLLRDPDKLREVAALEEDPLKDAEGRDI